MHDTSDHSQPPGRLALGDRVLDRQRGMLLDSSGAPVELRPQVWSVLQHLARNAGRVVTRDELFDAVWPGVVVNDGSITQAICDVRAALGDSEHRIVKTMPRHGYMLID
jgi:adenylate cyclase